MPEIRQAAFLGWSQNLNSASGLSTCLSGLNVLENYCLLCGRASTIASRQPQGHRDLVSRSYCPWSPRARGGPSGHSRTSARSWPGLALLCVEPLQVAPGDAPRGEHFLGVLSRLVLQKECVISGCLFFFFNLTLDNQNSVSLWILNSLYQIQYPMNKCWNRDWHCGAAGCAAILNANIPQGHWSESWLLHF